MTKNIIILHFIEMSSHVPSPMESHVPSPPPGPLALLRSGAHPLAEDSKCCICGKECLDMRSTPLSIDCWVNVCNEHTVLQKHVEAVKSAEFINKQGVPESLIFNHTRIECFRDAVLSEENSHS